MSTKEKFHDLIESIEDENDLRTYFHLITRLQKEQSGTMWEELSTEEKKVLLISYEESFFPQNLISHNEVRKTHSKWLDE